jgi:hypothetical protein
MIANDDRFDSNEFQNNQSLFETSIMHSSSLGWNFPLCRVPLSGVEALPKSALMSAFISVSTRSAFAAAFCNADFAFETKEEDSISQSQRWRAASRIDLNFHHFLVTAAAAASLMVRTYEE